MMTSATGSGRDTYNAWLPAMGVALPRYTGYKSNVNATMSTEFAAVGYRVHSQINGEFEFVADASLSSAADLDYIESQGSVYFLEINTMPGVMSGSLFPTMLAESGRDLTDLILLCRDAYARRSQPRKQLPYLNAH